MKKNELVKISIQRSDVVRTVMDYKEIKDIIDENYEFGVIPNNNITQENIEECFVADTSFSEKLHNGSSSSCNDKIDV